MILTSTDSIELVTTAATTIKIQYTCSWVDNAFAPSGTAGEITTATDTAIVAAPGGGVQRLVNLITLVNADTTYAQTITLQKDVSATEYAVSATITLMPGESVVFGPGMVPALTDANGVQKIDGTFAMHDHAIMSPVGFGTTGVASTRATADDAMICVYVGKARCPLRTFWVCFNVTTAYVAGGWCEVAVGTGPLVVNGNMTVTPRGYADIAAIANATGRKYVAVTLTAGQAVNAGDDVWVMIGNDSTGGTALVVRALSVADDLQVGVLGDATIRPSTSIGTGTVYTLAGAAVLAPWIAAIC